MGLDITMDMKFESLVSLGDWDIISATDADHLYGIKYIYILTHNCNLFPANITTYTAQKFRKCVNCSTPVPDDVFAIIHTIATV